MEGLSVTAFTRYSMPFDLQCIEIVKNPSEVWDSIQEVPQHIEAVSSDLEVLSSVSDSNES